MERKPETIKGGTMKPETKQLLYKVQDACKSLRCEIDVYMVNRDDKLPEEDAEYLRKVYKRICSVQDLL